MAFPDDDGRPEGLDGLERGLADAGRALESLDDGVGRAGRALTRAFVEGEAAALDFGAVARGVLADLSEDMLRLAVVNPLKNLVFDSGLPLLGGLVADAVGGLAGGGASAANAAANAAGGALAQAGAAGAAVSVIINTPDARSFLAPAAESQMSAQLARAVRRGQRGL
jgi:hypothetical protein